MCLHQIMICLEYYIILEYIWLNYIEINHLFLKLVLKQIL
jgi:hypothetical protein